MKILIVGSGIIGGIYGWAFSEAGHDVTHLVRPGRALEFSGGMSIDMYDVRKGHTRDFIGRYPIRVAETVRPADGYELVVVPVKHYRLLETLKQLVPQAGKAGFLLLTQNWDGTDAVDAILSPSRYVYGDAKAGGTFLGGTLVATIACVDIGQVGGRHDPCLDKVLTVCRSAQIAVTVQENILHYLWVQYAVTGGLWPALVRAGGLEAALSDRKTGEQGIRAAGECLVVTARRGVDLKKYPEIQMYRNTSPIALWVAGLAVKVLFRFNKLVRRSSAHGLADAREVRTFYYDLLNTGKELGVTMPAMSAFEPDIQRFVQAAG